MIYFLLLILEYVNENVNKKLVVGIMSGKENINTRVKHQSKTWMRFFDQIYVYTDMYDEYNCSLLYNRSNIKCVILGNDYGRHLIHTEYKDKWYFAQPRFLPSMEHLWRNNQDADWYILGDDDTYLFREPIYKKIQRYSPDGLHVIGRYYCTWDSLSKYFNNSRSEFKDCFPFPQCGSGIIISNGLMKKLASHLISCSLRYNDPYFAGSMRFAVCIKDVIGIERWTIDDVIHPWEKSLHSMVPEKEIENYDFSEPPGSFHQLAESDFYSIFNAHVIEYNNTYEDISNISFKKFVIPLGSVDDLFDYYFGFCVSFRLSLNCLSRSLSPWKQIGSGVFVQEYENDISITIQCDNKIYISNELKFTGFKDDMGLAPVFNITC